MATADLTYHAGAESRLLFADTTMEKAGVLLPSRTGWHIGEAMAVSLHEEKMFAMLSFLSSLLVNQSNKCGC